MDLSRWGFKVSVENAPNTSGNISSRCVSTVNLLLTLASYRHGNGWSGFLEIPLCPSEALVYWGGGQKGRGRERGREREKGRERGIMMVIHLIMKCLFMWTCPLLQHFIFMSPLIWNESLLNVLGSFISKSQLRFDHLYLCELVHTWTCRLGWAQPANSCTSRCSSYKFLCHDTQWKESSGTVQDRIQERPEADPNPQLRLQFPTEKWKDGAKDA